MIVCWGSSHLRGKSISGIHATTKPKRRICNNTLAAMHHYVTPAQMIKTAAAKPEQRVAAIMGSMRESGVLSDPTPPGFGMQIQNQMLQARVPSPSTATTLDASLHSCICPCCGSMAMCWSIRHAHTPISCMHDRSTYQADSC